MLFSPGEEDSFDRDPQRKTRSSSSTGRPFNSAPEEDGRGAPGRRANNFPSLPSVANGSAGLATNGGADKCDFGSRGYVHLAKLNERVKGTPARRYGNGEGKQPAVWGNWSRGQVSGRKVKLVHKRVGGARNKAPALCWIGPLGAPLLCRKQGTGARRRLVAESEIARWVRTCPPSCPTAHCWIGTLVGPELLGEMEARPTKQRPKGLATLRTLLPLCSRLLRCLSHNPFL